MIFFRKNNGVISVFLVIILVPCMLIASIFVDISRVRLARAVAESSADMALSTLMTYYDYDLSEYYGLMGSCQNISSYYSLATEYYDTALHSRDVDDEEIQLLYQRVISNVNGRFGGETISDILQIQNRTEGAVITPLDGANMYNATILQEQIVEFMKYRGPIVIAQEIIDKIKNDPGTEDLLEGDQNKPLTDNKTDFYKAEGKLLKTAFDVYWLTRAYTDRVGNNGENMSAGKLQEYAQSLEGYRTVYGEIHQYLVGNLINTGNLTSVYSRVTIGLDTYRDEYDETNPEIYSRMETPESAPTSTPAPGASPEPSAAPAPSSDPIYYIDGVKLTKLMDELTTARDNFIAAKDNFIVASDELMKTLPGLGDSDAYVIQWWVQMDAAVNSHTGTSYTAELENKAETLARAYAKVLATEGCTPDGVMPENWISKRENLLHDVESIHGQYLTQGIVNATDKYLNTVNQLERVSAENLSKLQASNLYVMVDGQSRSVSDAVTYIQGQLGEIQKNMRLYEGLLDKLLTASTNVFSPMDNLYSLAGNYASKLNNWTNSANHTSTNMAEEHREEIEELKTLKDTEEGKFQGQQTSDSLEISINREAVKAMKNRLANIRSQYQIIDDAIEEMKYGNTLLREILNVESMKNCANTKVCADSIGLTNQEVKEYAESTFSQLFVPNTDTIAKLHDIEDNSYNPLMSPETKNIDTPDLYIYMHSKFKDTSPDQVEKEEEEQENAQKEADDAEQQAKDKTRYHGNGKKIEPTSDSVGQGFSVGSALSGVVGIVKNLLNGEVDNIRDDLYVTTYIMKMFSYATFDNEGRYDLQDGKTELTLSTYPEAYKQTEGSANEEGTWLSANVKDSYNKTLTNRLICRENNAAYLAEVEYILYGNSTNEDNVKAAYKDIYAIRYALNFVSAFANFWSAGKNTTANVINGVAQAVAVLTAGIIPAALTKVILLPILAKLETCRDLDRLEAGFPVELYKQADDWWYGFKEGQNPRTVSDFMSGLTGDGKNKDKGLQYSDYLTLFVYLGLSSNQGNTSKRMYLRMADVIQSNMRMATGESGYKLINTQVYFKLKSKLRVEPLMLTLPYFSDYVDDPTMKDDWCTFEVETIRGY